MYNTVQEPSLPTPHLLQASAKSKIDMNDIVASGSDTQDINSIGSRKQMGMGHSSFDGESLNGASLRSLAARILHSALCFGQ
jgi:hypothetical protein